MENNNDLKENVKKDVKEKIAILNASKEFEVKSKKTRKVMYPILSVCALFVLCLVISKNVEFPSNSIKIAKNNNQIQKEQYIQEDNIVFNEGSIKSLEDIDGKWEDANLKEEFEFVDKINVPDGLYLSRQGKLFEREYINNDIDDYTKLWQYTLIYANDDKEDGPYIEITFTKEKYILGCLMPDEEKMPSSIINGKEVKLFKGKYIRDESKITGEAFLEKDGYKFYIEAHRIDEEDFINILKSILK